MHDSDHKSKHVIVHLGPHKTGSTAIQQCFSENSSQLLSAGICFLHNNFVHETAIQLVRQNLSAAEAALAQLSVQISKNTAETFIISQEDFCGDLPGRSRQKSIYPKLTKNLRIIARSLIPHRVTFVFFVRNATQWITSCYHQHLRYRTFFSRLEDFTCHFGEVLDWEEKLSRLREIFRDDFVTIPYNKTPYAGVQCLLKIAGRPDLRLATEPKLSNAAPEPEHIAQLERINALSSFKATAWFAKSLVLNNWSPAKPLVPCLWPIGPRATTASVALPDLERRARRRVARQHLEDILPPRDLDLKALSFDILPTDIDLPPISREEIRNQSRLLDYHLRGKSQLAKLNGLTISYLRRDTEHTEKARHLFHRIWAEEGVSLINELSTRWLISTLQTFLDHGVNEAQRIIGASGYFYANMMKIYEGERAIEGIEQDATHSYTGPQTANKFSGLDRYEIGGSDLLLNTNALALDLSTRDETAGIVLQEFLLRVKSSANVFTRMDMTRKVRQIEVKNFEDTWSFFTPPKDQV